MLIKIQKNHKRRMDSGQQHEGIYELVVLGISRDKISDRHLPPPGLNYVLPSRVKQPLLSRQKAIKITGLILEKPSDTSLDS